MLPLFFLLWGLLITGSCRVDAFWNSPDTASALQSSRARQRLLQQKDVQHCRSSLHQAAANAISELPIATVEPHTLVAEFNVSNGGTWKDERIDNYYWLMNEDKDKNVMANVKAYLNDENAYFSAVMTESHKLQHVLYSEISARYPSHDMSPPWRAGPYFYYGYRPKGDDYWLHCRRAVSNPSAPPSEEDTMITHDKQGEIKEEVLLDENKMAKDAEFFDMGDMEVSPDHQLLAYSIDLSGDELYGIHIQNLSTNTEITVPEELQQQMAAYVAWAPDNKTLYAVKMTKSTHRPYQVVRHTLGDGKVVTVFEEPDEHYDVSVKCSQGGDVMFISGTSDAHEYVKYIHHNSDEGAAVQHLNPDKSRSVQTAAQWGEYVLYLTYNEQDLLNGQLMLAKLDNPKKTQVLIDHNKDVLLEDIRVSSRFLSVLARHDGTQSIQVYTLPSNFSLASQLDAPHLNLTFEDVHNHALEFGVQADYESDVLRVRYTSLTHPWTTVDINQETGNQVVKKVDSAGPHYNSSNFESIRLTVRVDEGVNVPVSVVYNKLAAKRDGKDPTLIHVYGAYGLPNDPDFSRNELSLLNRGFIVAIAHVRGGNELGRYWHQDGKLMNKKNTFTDLLAVAQYLIQSGYSQSHSMCVWGRSAGGLTVGAAINMRPDLFKCAILDVPFVDALTTMRKEELPLTVPEWEEWGDPLHDREAYEYIKSYSPYDHVETTAYPDMMVTAGLHDPRVPYWQPAKYVAKLRKLKTDNNVLLLKTSLTAGHFSQSGLTEKLREAAMKYAFLLKSTGALCGSGLEEEDYPSSSASTVSAALGVLLLIAFVLAGVGYMGYRRYKAHGMPDFDNIKRKISGANSRVKEVAMRAFPQAAGYERTNAAADYLDKSDSDDEK